MACRKTGHFSKVCHSKPQTVHEVRSDETEQCSQEPNNQAAEIDELMADLFVGEIKKANNITPDLWFVDMHMCNGSAFQVGDRIGGQRITDLDLQPNPDYATPEVMHAGHIIWSSHQTG